MSDDDLIAIVGEAGPESVMAMNNDALFRCRCAHLSHLMALWFDDEPDGFDDLDVSMIVPGMPLRWRLRQAWNVLRGDAGHVANVSLNSEDAIRMRAYLAAYIERHGVPDATE